MAIDVRPGITLAIILGVASIPLAISLPFGYWSFVLCFGVSLCIGLFVDWLIDKYTDWNDEGHGGM